MSSSWLWFLLSRSSFIAATLECLIPHNRATDLSIAQLHLTSLEKTSVITGLLWFVVVSFQTSSPVELGYKLHQSRILPCLLNFGQEQCMQRVYQLSHWMNEQRKPGFSQIKCLLFLLYYFKKEHMLLHLWRLIARRNFYSHNFNAVLTLAFEK